MPKSVMQHDFSRNPSIDAPRSKFDLSHGHKTTFDAGQLIPFYVEDVLPGDTFNLSTHGFARMATQLFPVMDNMYMDTHFFFVPLRLVWDNARKFFGEQVNPNDSIDFTLPTFNEFTPTEGSLSDYLGLPPVACTPVSIYHRGCNLVWNEWFRDQNLQNSLVVDTDDGPDDIADYVLQRRGKRHDYFTSALIAPQKGSAVTIPLGTQADIRFEGSNDNAVGVLASTGSDIYALDTLGNANDHVLFDTATTPTNKIYTDLTTATASTVNDLREAFQIQKLLERDARGGTRYSELVANHFGVNFYDVSYRPEFLGGGSTPINVNPVAVTSDNTDGNPGDLGAFATVSIQGHGFTKSFVEHGFILGFVSVRADLTYQQGIHRRFLKSTRYDVYWPSLAHLGEQAITNAEIYYQNTSEDDDVFGYQERYAEYRYHPSRISGAFRSTVATPLDSWHLSQEFANKPVLGPTFIQENPPLDRVIAVSTEPHFIFDSYINIHAARPMPVFGIPGMIDHF